LTANLVWSAHWQDEISSFPLDLERPLGLIVLVMKDPGGRRATEVNNESLSIAEVSARTGLSAHTLRYYEKARLIDAVDRSSGGRRRYAASDLDWLAFLVRLRDTGMSIAGMQRFAELRGAGPSTVADRLDLLLDHRAEVENRIRSLHANAGALDQKIRFYEGLIQSQSERETSRGRPHIPRWPKPATSTD
jgi:DNA-binding transcriptional MerR regulator